MFYANYNYFLDNEVEIQRNSIMAVGKTAPNRNYFTI